MCEGKGRVVNTARTREDGAVGAKTDRRQTVQKRSGLTLKKNMTVHGSYSSYIVLKSGTSVMSTR